MSITILQIHKRASYEFKYIQDKYAISSDGKIFALADGTTQSFNSEIWAEIITSHFVVNPTFDFEKLMIDFKNCVQGYKNSKFEFSSNPAKASLERTKQNKGGTATFIGLQFLQGNQFNIISCGDTNLFMARNDKVEHFPYSDIDNLDANIFFINTEQLLQNKIDETYFQKRTFSYQNNDTLILATDALSRLLLKQPNIISELTAIKDFETLHKFCLTYWEKKEMEEDDISAIIIKTDSKNKIQKVLPSKNFSFPKEKEEEFIPTSLLQSNTEIKFTNMQMNEIRNQFNGIANDFHQVKKKQQFHEMLMIAAIGLLLISVLYSFFFQRSTTPENTEAEIQLQQVVNDKDNIIQTQQKEIDRLNKHLQIRDTPKIPKEGEPNIEQNRPLEINRQKAKQNIKIEKKTIDPQIEKNKDSSTTVNKPKRVQNAKAEKKTINPQIEKNKDSSTTVNKPKRVQNAKAEKKTINPQIEKNKDSNTIKGH